ncbi:MAG: hypothetical protein ACRDNK_23860, partial [Solirubrobacteraceae bacterium]
AVEARSFCDMGRLAGKPGTLSLVFHLELRQFPHVARAFNLTRAELDLRFARPWVSGSPVDHDDRRWTPEKARLIIFEGPELRTEAMGLGRGWANVGRTSQDVTETVLAEAQRGAEGRSTVEMFKVTLAGAARSSITLADVMELVSAEYPAWRVSERLALAEQAVWEMLHQGHLTLSDLDGAIESERWQPLLLRWSSWTGSGGELLVLDAAD